jgi:predicted amidohydrolase
MKIGIAQIQSHPADIDTNITHHVQVIERAADHQVELLVFPELSLTHYDTLMAATAAVSLDDPRFQQLSTANDMTVCVGVPLRGKSGVTISMLIFQPEKAVEVYSKQYLHADEEPFFVPGSAAAITLPDHLAFAICYDLAVPQHAQDAHTHGASVYIASVAKTPTGVVKASERLATIARTYGMTVFMSNCVGACEGGTGGGQSALWNTKGELLVQMDATQEGVIVYNPQIPHLHPEIISVAL